MSHDSNGTAPSGGGNRRIDRVLAVDFLDNIGDVPMDELRTMRREAEQEETDLSYLRRLLQGRLDILRAELSRRSGETTGDLVDSLPSILADEGSSNAPHGLGRHVTVEPSRADSHRRHVEALVADVDLSNPASHDEDSLHRAVASLEAEEREVSAKRRSVQQAMDACTAELTRRYRDGADPSDLLPTESSS